MSSLLAEFTKNFLSPSSPADEEHVAQAMEFLKFHGETKFKDAVLSENRDTLSHCLVRGRSFLLCDTISAAYPSLLCVTTKNSENLTALELALSLGYPDMLGLLSGCQGASLSGVDEKLASSNAVMADDRGRQACLFLIRLARSIDSM